MKEQNVQVTILPDGGAKQTVVIREGKAPDIKDPLVINISGDINTVATFIKNRQQASELQPIATVTIPSDGKVEFTEEKKRYYAWLWS